MITFKFQPIFKNILLILAVLMIKVANFDINSNPKDVNYHYEEHQLTSSDAVSITQFNLTIGASFCTQTGDIYAGEVNSSKLYKSTDSGISWAMIYNFNNRDKMIRSIFINQKGHIFVSQDQSGKLYRSEDNAKTFKLCLKLSNQTSSSVWHLAENKKGWLFAAEYSNVNYFREQCAYIYRSKDDGKTWETVYNNPTRARHFHFVAVDPYTEYIYAARGDGSNRAALLRSVDGGDIWVCIGHDSLNSNIDWQFTSVVFTPHYRIFGEDDPLHADIVRTADDIHFEKVYSPEGIERYCLWSWGRIDAKGHILFASWAQNHLVGQPQGCGVVILSTDEGATWTKVVDFGSQNRYTGSLFASNICPDGYIYCHCNYHRPGFKLRLVGD